MICPHCNSEIKNFLETCPFCGKEVHKKEENSSSLGDINNLLASRGKRFLNYILDVIFFYISVFAIGMLLTIIDVALSSMGFIPENLIIKSFDKANDYLIGILLLMLYYIPQEIFFNKTIGKFITKTRVVMVDSSKPTPKAVLIRTLGRFIPFEQFSYLKDPPTGLHDIISKTRVIDEKKIVINQMMQKIDEIDAKS